MSCSVELLNWFDSCCNDVEPQKKSLQLTANWSILPPDVVDIILDLLKQINFEFHTHNFQRIDKIPNVIQNFDTHTDRFGQNWTHTNYYLKRIAGSPPQFYVSKYLTKPVKAHKQSLPNTLKYIAQELEKRKQKSVDSNIKPSKMKYKYVKNITDHILAEVIYQNKYIVGVRKQAQPGFNSEYTGDRTAKVNPAELIMW